MCCGVICSLLGILCSSPKYQMVKSRCPVPVTSQEPGTGFLLIRELLAARIVRVRNILRPARLTEWRLRFACPVRPLGRLSLGLVIEGVGRWLPSPVGSPWVGCNRCLVRGYLLQLACLGLVIEGVGLGFPSQVSLPLTHIKPVSAIQQAPASRISFVIISRNSAFTLRRSQFVDSLHMDISPNCTTHIGRIVYVASNGNDPIDAAPEYLSCVHTKLTRTLYG